MQKDVVAFYVSSVLKKQLQKCKVSNPALDNIVSNVREQLYSILSNWCDVSFRNAILVVGSEEGYFYKPKNELIANMVVIAIRNSLLEGVSSKSYKEYGSTHYLTDVSIKEITEKAIIYFSKINLEELAPTIKPTYDFYRDMASKYPVAMKALSELSCCTTKEREHAYTPLTVLKVFEIEEVNQEFEMQRKTKNIESGIAPSFNQALLSFLKDIKDKKSKMYLTDSFKMTTRNFEKLLKIIEFTLTHDAIFLTCNYLLSKDYVARRENLLKAGHTFDDFFKKVPSVPAISKKYKSILEKLASAEEIEDK